MAKTGIEWADNSLNFYNWDCTRVSPGCKNCYMMAMANKFNRPMTGHPQWRGAKAYKELKAIEPGAVVFVNSMSDTYHESVPVAWIHGIHNAATYLRPDVIFLLLTKRPERALALSDYLSWPKNLWIGTSVETPEYLWRLDYLLQIPAVGHFISAEPLLDSLTELRPYLYPTPQRKGLGWVILGGESGDKRRMFKQDWAREVRDLCVKAKVPFLFKQGSALYPGQDRLLDKREWNEAPFSILKHEAAVPVLIASTVRKIHMDAPELDDATPSIAEMVRDAERDYLSEVKARHERIFERAANGDSLADWEWRIVNNRLAIECDRATRLNVAPGLDLSAEDFVGKHVGVLGMTGMGKSNLVAVLCEELAPHIQMSIIDLEGEYWSLRDKHPFLVVGRGVHVDRQIDVMDATRLVNEIMETGQSVILDMYEFDEDERNEFLRLYLNRLFEVEGYKKKPHIVVMEEAAEFLSQQKKSPVNESAVRLANRGRKRGISIIMASQRPAKLDKNVLNMSRILFLLGVQFPQDISAYRGALPKDFNTENVAKNLATGQAIVRRAGPDGKLLASVYNIRQRETKDLGATPKLQKQLSPEMA